MPSKSMKKLFKNQNKYRAWLKKIIDMILQIITLPLIRGYESSKTTEIYTLVLQKDF